MNKPLISVCIPVYKTPEEYLRRAIDILLKQTFQDFEIIIVNDLSDVNVKNIVFSYQDKISVDFGLKNISSKIRYFETKHVTGGRNIALNNAQGEYVFFHDHDDYLFNPENSSLVLEKMYSEVKDSNTDILIFNTKNWNGYTDLSFFKPLDISDKNLQTRDFEQYFQGDMYAIWSKLFRKDFLLKNNIFFKEKIKNSDYEIFFRYIFATKNIKVSTSCYYYYFNNPQSVFHNNNHSEYYKFYQSIKNIKRTLVKYNIYEKCRIPFINSVLTVNHTLYHPFELFKAENPLKIKNFIRKYINMLDITDDDIEFFKHYKYNYPEFISEIIFYL